MGSLGISEPAHLSGAPRPHPPLVELSGESHTFCSLAHTALQLSRRTTPTAQPRQPYRTLTGAVPKLKADVRAPEFIHGNGQLQQLGPAGAVVVVKHEGAVLASGRLSGAEGDKILAEETRRRHLKVIPKAASNRLAVCRLPKQHSTWNDPLHVLLPLGSGRLILRLVSQSLLCQGWASVTWATGALASGTTQRRSP